MNLTLPWPPKELSPNARLHHMALHKAKKAYRLECAWQAKAQGATKIEADRLDVEFIFYPPTRRRIDPDNCLARMKAGIDGLVDVLQVDDSRWRITFSVADQVGGMVRVRIVPVSAPSA